MVSCTHENAGMGKGKKDLYKTAVGIFSRKGYHDATIDEIAQTTGIAKGTIYYRYKNKEELYFALIKEGINILCESVSEAVKKVDDPEEKMKILLSSQLEFINDNSDIAFIFLRELFGNVLNRDILKEMINQYYQIISEILIYGKDKNIYNFENLEVTTPAIFGMISVTAFHYLNMNGCIPLNEVVPALEKLVLNALQ